MGMALEGPRCHGPVASEIGSQHVLAALMTLPPTAASKLTKAIVNRSYSVGFPEAVFDVRQTYMSSGQNDPDPDDLLALLGIGYFSDLQCTGVRAAYSALAGLRSSSDTLIVLEREEDAAEARDRLAGTAPMDSPH